MQVPNFPYQSSSMIMRPLQRGHCLGGGLLFTAFPFKVGLPDALRLGPALTAAGVSCRVRADQEGPLSRREFTPKVGSPGLRILRRLGRAPYHANHSQHAPHKRCTHVCDETSIRGHIHLSTLRPHPNVTCRSARILDRSARCTHPAILPAVSRKDRGSRGGSGAVPQL